MNKMIRILIQLYFNILSLINEFRSNLQITNIYTYIKSWVILNIRHNNIQ